MGETKKPEWVPTEYSLPTDDGSTADVSLSASELGGWSWKSRYADSYAGGEAETEADAKRFAEEALAFLRERAR